MDNNFGILTTTSLNVGYSKNIIVNDINLSINPGEIMTLIGPNGCGKSTVLKTIISQLKAIDGSMKLNGRELESMNSIEVAREISMVMTDHIKPELMSCREVVATARYPYTGRLGILSKKDWKLVDEAMELLDAAKLADKSFTQISDGQRQRVMLARAICQDTGLLILDEPTSFLDMKYKLEILTAVRRLAKERKLAVIMSLHELELAQRIADTVICIENGRIGRAGKPSEVFSGDYIQRLYGVDKECYNPLTGMMFLPGEKLRANTFVIGGGGEAINIYNELSKNSEGFYAGIIFENDVEFMQAKALANKVISVKAFHPIEDGHIRQAKALIDEVGTVVVATHTGPFNERLNELVNYAREKNKSIKVMV